MWFSGIWLGLRQNLHGFAWWFSFCVRLIQPFGSRVAASDTGGQLGEIAGVVAEIAIEQLDVFSVRSGCHGRSPYDWLFCTVRYNIGANFETVNEFLTKK
jgi:hypothetical protein